MWIDGFGIAGYRSFGSELQRLFPTSRINIIIGPNNAGKSGLLRFIVSHYSQVVRVLNGSNNVALEAHLPSRPPFRFSLPVKLRANDGNYKYNLHVKAVVEAISRHEDSFWLPFIQGEHGFKLDNQSLLWLYPAMSQNDWQNVAMELTRGSSSRIEENVNKVVSHIIEHWSIPSDKVVFVPDLREIREGAHDDAVLPYDLIDGQRIVQTIGAWERPVHENLGDKEQFERVEKFVQEVLGVPDARLEVPRVGDYLLVYLNGTAWKLDQLGRGLHEIVILAAAATQYKDRIICIEEPEIHLHPELQRRLLSFLSRTENQFFISTHSAHIIDTPGAQIFHMIPDSSGVKISLALTERDKSEVCNMLGYRPSDLLQTNCIIWVEGPSDRIYINNWIAEIRKDLKEGVHYSIMFYGGSLGAYLSDEDVPLGETGNADELPEPVQDLILVRRLNQKSAIVLDSDKKSENEKLQPVKERLFDSFNKPPSLAWITKGRTIENYYWEKDVQNVVTEVHPGSKQFLDSGKKEFTALCTLKAAKSGNKRDARKVEVAKRIVQRKLPTRDDLDLNYQVNTLVRFILSANNMAPSEERFEFTACGCKKKFRFVEGLCER